LKLVTRPWALRHARRALAGKLSAMRQPGESYSDLILRLAAVGHD
jgi:hypothetical protein